MTRSLRRSVAQSLRSIILCATLFFFCRWQAIIALLLLPIYLVSPFLITDPAHLHATWVAVYLALFSRHTLQTKVQLHKKISLIDSFHSIFLRFSSRFFFNLIIRRPRIFHWPWLQKTFILYSFCSRALGKSVVWQLEPNTPHFSKALWGPWGLYNL